MRDLGPQVAAPVSRGKGNRPPRPHRGTPAAQGGRGCICAPAPRCTARQIVTTTGVFPPDSLVLPTTHTAPTSLSKSRSSGRCLLSAANADLEVSDSLATMPWTLWAPRVPPSWAGGARRGPRAHAPNVFPDTPRRPTRRWRAGTCHGASPSSSSSGSSAASAKSLGSLFTAVKASSGGDARKAPLTCQVACERACPHS